MAANLTVKMNGNATAKKVTNGEWAIILAYHQGLYTTTVNGVTTIPTEAQVVTLIGNIWIDALIANAFNNQKTVAAATAAAAVAPIVPTTDVPA